MNLKSCPFCGSEARINVIEPHTHHLSTFMPDIILHEATVECTYCSCMIIVSGESKELAIINAINHWNKRI